MSRERVPAGDATGGTGIGESGVSAAGRRTRGRLWLLAAVAGTVVVPSLLWAAILAVPFLPLTTGGKIWASGGLAVAAEAVFWVSALLVGRKVARRYRRLLDPRAWLRKLKLRGE